MIDVGLKSPKEIENAIVAACHQAAAAPHPGLIYGLHGVILACGAAFLAADQGLSERVAERLRFEGLDKAAEMMENFQRLNERNGR